MALGLKRDTDIAALFGVTKQAVSKWTDIPSAYMFDLYVQDKEKFMKVMEEAE